jgi:hypothetical protein
MDRMAYLRESYGDALNAQNRMNPDTIVVGRKRVRG